MKINIQCLYKQVTDLKTTLQVWWQSIFFAIDGCFVDD